MYIPVDTNNPNLPQISRKHAENNGAINILFMERGKKGKLYRVK